MTKYLVLDTEGSGLFDYSKPADAEGQPRLATLSMIRLHDGHDGDELLPRADAEQDILIRPEGWTLAPEMEAINGLTQERLERDGVPVAVALDAYERWIKEGYIVVAQNAQHDCKTMRAEFHRAGRPDLFEETKNICTMRASMKLVGAKNAKGGLKFPKLEEAHRWATGRGLDAVMESESKSMRDARAVLPILAKLAEADALPEPEIHYAKTPPAGKEV